MTYREFVEHAKRYVRNMRQGFTAPDDDWPASFVVELPDGGRQSGRLPAEAFESEHGKDVLAEGALPRLIRATRARKLALVLTTWAVITERDGEPVDTTIAPSRHPDRQEALTLAVYDAERLEVWIAPIRRHRKRPPTLGEWGEPYVIPSADTTAGGRFVQAIHEAFR